MQTRNTFANALALVAGEAPAVQVNSGLLVLKNSECQGPAKAKEN
jgi:hypothetical protein